MPTRHHLFRHLCLVLVPVALVACGDREADDTLDTAAGAVGAAVDTAAARVGTAADDRDDVVERALDGDSTLAAFGLDADDDDGRIVLKGAVRTDAQKDLAMQVATREAAGLTIDNRIRVDANARADARPTDVDDVEDQVEDAIEADTTLRELNIDVDEENGQIVLGGTVRSAAHKSAAEALAKQHAGNVAVVNRIRVQ